MLERFVKQTKYASQEDFIKNFKVEVPENFNFGYNVVDAWAAEQPDKKAILWTNDQGLEHQYTYAELKEKTDATAAYFQSLGIGKGDMAMLIPIASWQEVRKELQSVKKNIFLLAEAEGEEFFDDAFDACYGWELHHAMVDVAQGKSRVWALRDKVYSLLNNYPQTSMHLSFTSNHDENSWSGTEFSRMGLAHEAMSLFTFVAPRSLPLIYTGQEIGYDHVFQFFDRDPIRKYAPNHHTERYRKLIRLYHENRALWANEGEWVEIRNNAEDCLMILVRETADNRVIAVMNLSPYTIQAEYNTGIYAGRYTDFMAEKPYALPTSVSEIMAPWAYRVLTLQK